MYGCMCTYVFVCGRACLCKHVHGVLLLIKCMLAQRHIDREAYCFYVYVSPDLWNIVLYY